MKSSLKVYVVSFFNGDEIVGSVWEDLEKAQAFASECMAEFEAEDPWSREYDDLAEHITLGEWKGENTFILGKEGICNLTCFSTNLKLG